MAAEARICRCFAVRGRRGRSATWAIIAAAVGAALFPSAGAQSTADILLANPCACRPVWGAPPASQTAARWPAAPGNFAPVPLGVNGDNVVYFGPEGAVPAPCDPALQDPRDVPVGVVLVNFTAGYVFGEDVLFLDPPSANGPTLFYTSAFDAATGSLTLGGRTQLARQMLALSNVRYTNTAGAAATPGERTVVLTAYTLGGCPSTEITTVVLVGGVPFTEPARSPPAAPTGPVTPVVPLLAAPSPGPAAAVSPSVAPAASLAPSPGAQSGSARAALGLAAAVVPVVLLAVGLPAVW